jgi:hypothetical protein
MFGRPDFHLCSPLSVVSGQWSVVSGEGTTNDNRQRTESVTTDD